MASEAKLKGAVFECSVCITSENVKEVSKHLNNIQSLSDVRLECKGLEIDNDFDISTHIGNTVKFTFRMPRKGGIRFYADLKTFLESHNFMDKSKVKLPDFFYLFEEDLYYSAKNAESDDDPKLDKLKKLVSGVCMLEELAHYHDDKQVDSRTLVYLAGESRTPIVLVVDIDEELLDCDVTFTLLRELTQETPELHMHYSDRLSVFYASLNEHLADMQNPIEAFKKLIRSWDKFSTLYSNNLMTYLSGFSFHKAKQEIAETEIELSEKLTNLTSDIVFKLFSVPAMVLALAAILQKNKIDIIVMLLLGLGVIITTLLMFGLLRSQENKYDSLQKAKNLMFNSIDGKSTEFPEDLNQEIVNMKERLNEHFSSASRWLKRFKFAIASPIVAFVLFLISA